MILLILCLIIVFYFIRRNWISNKKLLDFYLMYMCNTYTKDEMINISKYAKSKGIKKLTIPMIENLILNEKIWRKK